MGTALWAAARFGSTNAIVQLAHCHARLDDPAANGITPLLISAHHGHEPAVRLLIASRCDVNKTVTSNNFNAVLVAADGGHAGVVPVLVEAKVDARHRDNNLRTAMIVAAGNGHDAVLRELLAAAEEGADDALGDRVSTTGATVLHVACEQDRASTVELLLHARANPAVACNAGPSAGVTPLHLAAAGGRDDAVRALLATGRCDLDAAVLSSGVTPLLVAAFHGHLGVATLLAQARCDVDKATADNVTAVFLAATEGRDDMLQVLVAARADVNRRGWEAGAPPLCVRACVRACTLRVGACMRACVCALF